ncbi:AP-1 complex subunit sigma-3 [Lates japonicus]|uniref:AP-1 complex subunit sigma-3 n=1 Tax=Lates japonicus TaxID=270547 RepID=A0AAD3MFB5_LATJO|nr:AP-1 complex subunit sigma-3 [Lates japonicus]
MSPLLETHTAQWGPRIKCETCRVELGDVCRTAWRQDDPNHCCCSVARGSSRLQKWVPPLTDREEESDRDMMMLVLAVSGSCSFLQWKDLRLSQECLQETLCYAEWVYLCPLS